MGGFSDFGIGFWFLGFLDLGLGFELGLGLVGNFFAREFSWWIFGPEKFQVEGFAMGLFFDIVARQILKSGNNAYF